MCSPLECTTPRTHDTVESILFKDKTDAEIAQMRVLDIPCGAGGFTQRVIKRGAACVPSDIVDGMSVDEGRSDFAPADMDKHLPFGDSAFTDIVCIDGIEHIRRGFDFIRECQRILKPGGRIILSTPNISSARSRLRWFLTGHHNKCESPLNEERVTPLHHVNMLSYPDIRYLLHSNGFEIRTVAANRIKIISCFYAVWMPLLYIATRWTYRKEESDPSQRARNRETLSTMFSPAVYFGETLIVSAIKREKAVSANDAQCLDAVEQ